MVESEKFIIREHERLVKELKELGGGIESLTEVKDAEGNIVGWREPHMKFPHIPFSEYIVIETLKGLQLNDQAKAILDKIPQEYADHLSECKVCTDVYNKHAETK